MSRPTLLRTVAILIALAGLLDPGWSSARPAVPRLIAIDLTEGGSDAVIAAIQQGAPGWQVVPRRPGGSSPASRRLPCGPHERCVMVADGSVDVDVPRDSAAPVSIVAIRGRGPLNLAMQAASASPAHLSAAGAVRVQMARTGSIPSTEVRVFDGAALVGSRTYQWVSGETAAIDVPWWPIDSGSRTLRIEAVPADGETITMDNVIELGAAVADAPSRVLVFAPRPSWNSTFVRRALEDDPRFLVDYRARVAPSLSAGSPGGELEARTLDASPVVIIGSPDALTANDVALLERYVMVRGGSLVLLPESRMTGPAARLLPGTWSERLLTAPESIGPLRASEILSTDSVVAASTVLGRAGSPAPGNADGSASIVMTPSGNGRTIISGAMDAWRYRHLDAAGFDRFWRSLVAEAAGAGEALRIDLPASLAASGDRLPVTMRLHTLEPLSAIEARMTVRCGAGPDMPMRLWPSGSAGEFAGEIAIGTGGSCEVNGAVSGKTAHAVVAVAAQPRHGVDATLAKLERDARATGGVFAAAGDEAAIGRALDAQSSESSQIVSVHPLRSPWWILPFAGCLSAEWWLRRRAGLR
jgi:hypothetical protein